jgi:hypothetical protein
LSDGKEFASQLNNPERFFAERKKLAEEKPDVLSASTGTD